MDTLVDMLYETLRDEEGKLCLTVPVPVKGETEEEDDDE